MDPDELGFDATGRYYVACRMCDYSGGGVEGDYDFVVRHPQLSRWQLRHLVPHVHLCVCGRAHPSLQALGTHVAQCRRHRIPGHGVLHKVGP